MKQLVLAAIFALALIPTLALANEDAENEKVIWSCAPWGESRPEVLQLVDWGDQSYVRVFDEKIPAKYKMDGLEKRWDWSKYAVLLAPDGTAEYGEVKFGKPVPRERYSCKKK